MIEARIVSRVRNRVVLKETPKQGEVIYLVWPNGRYKEKVRVQSFGDNRLTLLARLGYTETYEVERV